MHLRKQVQETWMELAGLDPAIVITVIWWMENLIIFASLTF